MLFYEGTLTNKHKKYIRFLSDNKLIKENIQNLIDFNISLDFKQNMKYFDNPGFVKLFYSLLPVDYALLVQKDPATTTKTRYILSHFNVKLDWPITDAAENLAKEGLSCEVIDLRTISPLDMSTILGSLEKTSRLVTVEEGTRSFGVGAEISARVMDEGFDLLDSPVLRIGALDAPIPFSPALEKIVLPNAEKITSGVKTLLASM